MIRLACLFLALFALAIPAAAHQQKVTFSTIAVNGRPGMLEVMHQVPVHDAEHALRHQGDRLPDLIGNVESREAFASYVADRFALAIDGAPVELNYVGSEVKGRSLWVYQEAPAPPPGATISVNSQILTDVWARQENRVNLGGGTNVRTLVFRRGDGLKDSTLPE